jgi:hypothetical protein
MYALLTERLSASINKFVQGALAFRMHKAVDSNFGPAHSLYNCGHKEPSP